MDAELTSNNKGESVPSAVQNDSSIELNKTESPKQLHDSEKPQSTMSQNDKQEMDQPNTFAASHLEDVAEISDVRNQNTLPNTSADFISNQDIGNTKNEDESKPSESEPASKQEPEEVRSQNDEESKPSEPESVAKQDSQQVHTQNDEESKPSEPESVAKQDSQQAHTQNDEESKPSEPESVATQDPEDVDTQNDNETKRDEQKPVAKQESKQVHAQNNEELKPSEPDSIHDKAQAENKGETVSFVPSSKDSFKSQTTIDHSKEVKQDALPKMEPQQQNANVTEDVTQKTPAFTDEGAVEGVSSSADDRVTVSNLFANDEPSSLGFFDNLTKTADFHPSTEMNSSEGFFGQFNQGNEINAQDETSYNNYNESQLAPPKSAMEPDYEQPVSASTEPVLSSSSKHLEMDYRNEELLVPNNEPFSENNYDKEATGVYTDGVQRSSSDIFHQQSSEPTQAANKDELQGTPAFYENPHNRSNVGASQAGEETEDLFQNNPEEEERFFNEVLQPHEQASPTQPKDHVTDPSLNVISSFEQPSADEDVALFNKYANNETPSETLPENSNENDNELIDDSEFSSLLDNFLKPVAEAPAQSYASSYIPAPLKQSPTTPLPPLDTRKHSSSQISKPFVASKEGYSSPYDLPEEIVQQAQQKRSATYTSARKAAQISASKVSSPTLNSFQGLNASLATPETVVPPSTVREPVGAFPGPPVMNPRLSSTPAPIPVAKTVRASDSVYGKGRYTPDLSSKIPSAAPRAPIQEPKTLETKPPITRKYTKSPYAPIVSPNELTHVQQVSRPPVSYTPVETQKPLASVPSVSPPINQAATNSGFAIPNEPPTVPQTKVGYSPLAKVGRAYPSVPDLQSHESAFDQSSPFMNGSEIQSIRGSTAPPLSPAQVHPYTPVHNISAYNRADPTLNQGYNTEHAFPSDIPGTTLPPPERPMSRTRSPVFLHRESIPDRPATVSLPAKQPYLSERKSLSDLKRDPNFTESANSLSIETRVGNNYLSAHSAQPYSNMSSQPLDPRSNTVASVPVSPNFATSNPINNIFSSNETVQQQIDLIRTKPKPIICFGPCGTVITSFPVSTQFYSVNGRKDSLQPGLLKLQSLSDVVPQAYEYDNKFPGPFIASNDKLEKNAKNAAKEWISKYIENLKLGLSYASPDDATKLEDKLLLLQTMEQLLSIPDMSKFPESLVKILVPGFEKPAPCNTETTVQELISPERSVDSSPVVSAGNTTGSFLERIYGYLLIGDKEEALNFALQEKQWSFALIISFALGPKVLEGTVRSFAKSEVKMEMLKPGVGINLQLALQLLSGADAASLSEFSSTSSLLNLSAQSATTNALASWKELVANIICSQYKDKNNALIELGKLLLQERRVYAAHLVFMLTFSSEICSQHPQSLFHLLGLPKDGSLPTREELLDSVQLTEVLALIYSIHIDRGVITYPHLMNDRLYLATTLSENGETHTAKKYCELIGTYLNKASKKQSNLDPDFIFAVRDLTQQIFENSSSEDVTTSWLGRTVSRPRLDNVLSSLGSKFSKFVAGENDYDISRPATANDGPFGKVAAHQEATSRAGSAMGYGSKNDMRPYSSGVLNSNDMIAHYGMGQGSTPYMNRYEPAGVSNEFSYAPPSALQEQQDNISSLNLAAESQVSSPRQMQAQFGLKQPSVHGSGISHPQYTPLVPPVTAKNAYMPRTSVEEGFENSVEGEPLESPYQYRAPVPEAHLVPTAPQYAPSQYAPSVQTNEPSPYAPINTNAYVPKAPEAQKEQNQMERLTTSMQDLSFNPDRSEQAKRAAAQNVAELVKREEEEKAKEKAAASEKKSNKKGWFSKLLRRDDNKEQSSVYQAKLGEKSHLRYDKELRRWVNEDGSDLNNQVAPPPPPPKINPSKSMGSAPPSVPMTMPTQAPNEITPPVMPVPSAAATLDEKLPSASVGLPTTLESGNSPGLPNIPAIPPASRATPGAKTASADPLEDILHSVPPPATGRRGKGKTSKRYVDIMRDT
ncbi:multidomain vesicle coat component Sec16 [Schizosaccharomyces octosporus yFS286]|uniref:Protein transport protein sec16 n=1 Tax=Schizosaccharomyces octosporus (strain yFS286) TaxID=483514 RepID=S9RB14_SCHOY|nr:multidomain vesicle coat component Sec16 [Schizosaccharomyces octosporus yFS286]EPX75335.1 multidomain vesicle coat component Sec16 [Schizosaccharomyces octosporus yFS286]